MSNSFTPLEIKNKLLQALDDQNNIVDMRIIVDTISILEKTALTREALEQTRLGKYVNEIRKKLTSGSAPKDANQTEISQVAKRAKNLVKRWRDNLLPTNDQSNTLAIPGEKTPKSEQLIFKCEEKAHNVNNVMTDVVFTKINSHYSTHVNCQLTEHSLSPKMSSTLFSTQTHVLESTTAQPIYVNGILSPKNSMGLSKDVLGNYQSLVFEKNTCNVDLRPSLSNGNNSTNQTLKPLPSIDISLSHTNSSSICLTQNISDQALTISAMLSNSLYQSKCTDTMMSSNTLIESSKSALPQKPRKLKTTAELMAEIRAKSKVMSLPSMSQVSKNSISPAPLQPNTPTLSPTNHTQIKTSDLEQSLTNKRKGRHKKLKIKDLTPDSDKLAHTTIADTISSTTYPSDTIVQLESCKNNDVSTTKLKIIVQEPKISQVLEPPQTISSQPTISSPTKDSFPIPALSPNPLIPTNSPNGLLDSYNSMFTQEHHNSPKHQIDNIDSLHLQSWLGEIDLVEESHFNQHIDNKPPSFETPYITDSLNDEKLIVLPFADLED